MTKLHQSLCRGASRIALEVKVALAGKRGAWFAPMLAVTLLGPVPLVCSAYESDVHFGLTKWLALQAGFDVMQANSIALGNQRVDGGLMDTLTMSPEFACEKTSARVAREQQNRHFPASSAVPSSSVAREVVPGALAARVELMDLEKMLPGKELLLLARLGEALHPLQDSWAHRGPPGSSDVWEALMHCDRELLSLHGAARGNPTSHDADVTYVEPYDLVNAARATYDVLKNYPLVLNAAGKAPSFEVLRAAIVGFALARTKGEKREWFEGHGISEISFLAGISLPDGNRGRDLHWSGRRLPALETNESHQHDVDPEIRAFFDAVLKRLTSRRDLEKVAAEVTASNSALAMALKMRLWLLRDHGTAAPFLHGRWPLRGKALTDATRLTRSQQGLIPTTRYSSEAVFPLQALANYATPLLPYVTRTARPGLGGNQRAVALLRFVHAPYDTVALVAERHGSSWRLVDIVATPDH
jgi:hypothetical protein